MTVTADDIKFVDNEVYSLIKKEENRARTSITLVASENFTTKAVMQANGSFFTNKYSEGRPNARYYGGNEFVDELELLAEKRAKELFGLGDDWCVNLQPYSGSGANFAVYTGLIGPNGKLMGMDLFSGGHLTHGFQTKTKKISASALFFKSKGYRVNEKTGILDYDQLKRDFDEFQPDLLICGASAYPRDWDYKKLREIAGSKFLMADIAHVNGFIAHGFMNNPFEYCDVVTTTTHKIMRGPRAGMIFFKKKLANKINSAVFPMLQGGPHNQTIAGIAVALKLAMTPEYKEYTKQVLLNAKKIAEELMKRGYNIVTDGTDTHIVNIDLRNKKVNGNDVQVFCEMVNIELNKNSIPGDISALNPSGVRLGTCALTTRNYNSDDVVQVVEFFDEAVKLAENLKENTKENFNFKSFSNDPRVVDLKSRIVNFSSKFPLPVNEI
ncbi:Serine hydroxymethyltransferase, cytosolic [Dictyocoela muelleri]|nr:Serine hydroxymethyltransferase, cytosolic [Dictyocoela muelleri]